MLNMNVLEVKKLNLGFETESGFKQALYDVSFSLEKGKIHALVGESGCGKTITAMSILQLLPKTARITGGEIIFNAQQISFVEPETIAYAKQEKFKLTEKELVRKESYESVNLLTLPPKELEKIRGAQIALIPQDPMTSLNPLYTIGDQLIEVIEKHQGGVNDSTSSKGSLTVPKRMDRKEAEQKAIEALEMVQIPDAKEKLNVYPHEFSGGMKQRAIIAMALACRAQIIIADEPTTALDVTIQAQIMDLLDNIKKELGTSILLITHNLALVQDCADDISVMYAGKIVEHASTASFFRQPLHPYSQALLKALPGEKKEKLAIIEGQPPSIQQNITGCKFHPRCEFEMEVCSREVPQLAEVGLNHFYSCHLNKENKQQ